MIKEAMHKGGMGLNEPKHYGRFLKSVSKKRCVSAARRFNFEDFLGESKIRQKLK